MPNMNEVVDRFNSFFVNVGPKLTNEIDNGGMRYAEEKCVERNLNSIVLGTVESKEIIDVVNKCTGRSTFMSWKRR